MHSKTKTLLFINLVGGPAVLGSYVYGIMSYPHTAHLLWGDVPEAVIPFYTANMFVAAAGYLLFTWFVLFRIPPDSTTVLGRYGYGYFSVATAVILLFSAIWMPLTLWVMDHSRPDLLVLVQMVLMASAIGSIMMTVGLCKAQPVANGWGWRLALIGALAFCSQTVVLDALVWPRFFHL